jgi:hypothetical protein
MRRSRTATATLTGLLGLVAFFGLASPADAEPDTQVSQKTAATVPHGGSTGGMIITTPTTKPEIPEADLVFPAKPAKPADADLDIAAAPGGKAVVDPSGGPTNDPCAPLASCPQDGECTLGTADPDCPPPHEDPCNQPGGPTCPDPDGDCTPIPGTSGHNCPETEGDCDDPIARHHGDPCDPCVPEDDGPGQAVRDRGNDPCNPCEDGDRPSVPRSAGSECCPDTERPNDPGPQRANATTGGTTGGGTDTGGRPGDRPGDRPDDCGGTTGGTGGVGSTGDSRLPKTGAELLTYAAAGATLTGFGFGLKRLGRKVA